MLKKFKWRILGVLAFLLILGGALWYRSIRESFLLPKTLVKYIENHLNAEVNGRVVLGRVEAYPTQGRLVIYGVQVLPMDGEKPVFSAEKIEAVLGEKRSFMGVWKKGDPLDRVTLFDCRLDLMGNLTGLLKTDRHGRKGPPVEHIRLDTLEIKSPAGMVLVQDIESDFPFQAKNTGLRFRLVRNPFSGEAQASGSFALDPADPSRVFLTWNDLDLKAVHGGLFLGWLFGVPETSGKMDCMLNWEGNLSRRYQEAASGLPELVGKELSGWIRFRDGATTWKNEKLRFEGSVERNGDASPHLQVSIGWASGSTRIIGNLQPGSHLPGDLDMQVLSEKSALPEGVRSALASIGIEVGTFDLSSQIALASGVASLDGSGTAYDLVFRNFPIPEARLDFEKTPETWFGNYRFNLDPGFVAGAAMVEGTMPPDLGSYSLTGAFAEVPIAEIGSFSGLDLGGLGTGDFFASGTLTHFASSGYWLGAEIRQPRMNDLAAESLSGVVSGSGPAWTIWNPLLGCRGGGTIALHGRLTKDAMVGSLFGDQVPLEFFGVDSGIVGGGISFFGTVAGTPAKPGIRGDAWADHLDILGTSFAPIRSEVKITGHRLALSPIGGLLAEGGAVEGNLELDLKNGELLETMIEFEALEISQFRALIPDLYRDLCPVGKISGTFQKKLVGIANAWDFRLTGNNLSLASESVTRLTLEGSILGNQFEIATGTLHAFGGSMIFSGKYLPDSGFQVAVSGADFALGKLRRVQNAFPKSAGDVSFDGEIFWNSEEKKGFFTVFGKNFVFRGQDVGNGGAEIRVDEREVYIHQAAFDRLGIQATGRLSLVGDQEYEFALKLKDADFSFLLSAYGYGFQRGECKATGKAVLGGVLSEPGPRLFEVNLDPVVLQRNQDTIVANRPIEILYQNGRFEFRSFEWKYRNGVLGVEGILDPLREVALTLSGKDFSLAALGTLLEKQDWPFDGTISLEGGVSGTTIAPRLKSTIKLRDFVWGKRKIPEVSAHIAADPTGVELTPLEILFPKNAISLHGFVPFSPDSGKDLNVEIRIASGPVDDFVQLFPEVLSYAKGSISAALKCFGNPRQPVISGDLRLESSELAFKGMPKPLKNVIVGLKTTDRILQITPLQADVGRGKISGQGVIDFREGPGSTTIDLTGKNLDLTIGGLEFAQTEGSVRVTGDLYNPVVRGKVTIPRGRMQVGDQILKIDTRIELPLQTLDYLFDVKIPRNFWLKHSLLNAEMRGDFRIAGDLDKVRLEGGFQTVQGWLYFQRRKFLIDTGEVKFGERDGKIDPHFYFKSRTNLQNTQVFLTLSGSVSSFTPRLHSSPPMDEGDLLALLTFNRRLDQTMAANPKDLLEKEILEGLKNTYLSGFIGSTISTALNLDELFLDSLFDRTTGITRSFLRIGKYLGHNFFVAYEGTLSNEERKAYILEYRLPRGFVVNLEFEKPTNRMQVGVKYDWKF